MNCDEVSELLIDYIEGELPRRQIQAIALHLETCDRCGNEAEQTEGVLETLSVGPEDPGDVYFQGLYSKVSRRIDASEGLPWYRRIYSGGSLWKWWGLAAAPAALAVLLIVSATQPNLFGTGIFGKNSKPMTMYMKANLAKDTIAAQDPLETSVAELSEPEADDLHNALLLALADVLTEVADESTAIEQSVSAPGDPAALPSSLYGLDPDSLGDVLDKLSKTETGAI